MHFFMLFFLLSVKINKIYQHTQKREITEVQQLTHKVPVTTAADILNFILFFQGN